MNIIKINNLSDYKLVADNLERGGVGVILSDTIYGLSCSIDRPLAINKIYQIKNIKYKKKFVVLISDLSMIKEYFNINKEQECILKDFWLDDNSRPTTFILNPKNKTSKMLSIKEDQGVAVRLPKNDFLIKLIKSLKIPLISTSCNLSGEKNLNSLKKIFSFFKFRKNKPDFIVKYSKIKPKRNSSRIIDIRKIDNIKLIRS